MRCTACGQPTRLRPSGLLVHEDRTRDADHLPPTPEIGIRLHAPEPDAAAVRPFNAAMAALEQSYRRAGYTGRPSSALEERRLDGDR
jgi:hypothetical protein